MSNMSYCRFENTLSDLLDCEGALHDLDYDLDGKDEHDEPLSKSEHRAAKQLLQECRSLAETFKEELDLWDRQ